MVKKKVIVIVQYCILNTYKNKRDINETKLVKHKVRLNLSIYTNIAYDGITYLFNVV